MEIFSFFSGIGFLDLGFETAGADISFVNENNNNFFTGIPVCQKK